MEGELLDLTEDIDTDFTYSIQDIREPDKRRTDFSKTIDLPGTPKNNALFAQIFDINVENEYNPALPNIGYNFNPNKAAKVIVLVDGIQVFRGVLRLLKVTRNKDLITYETNVLGRLSDILFALGDSKLSDLDFSDLDHTLDVGTIEASWYGTPGTGYVYPLIDYGMSVDGVNFPITGFRPAVYVLEYINRIFANAGFTYKCNFFAQPYFRGLHIPCTEKKEYNQTATQARFLECYSRERYTVNRRTGQWREVYNWWGGTVVKDKYGFIEVTDDESRGTKIIITRNITTSFQFSMWFIVKNEGCYMNIRKNGQVIASKKLGSYHVVHHQEIIEIPKQDWVAGDVLTMSMDMSPRNVSTIFPESSVIAPSPTDDSPYPVDDGAPVMMHDLISSSVAQKDFFKSIILMHNLYVFTDENDDKNLIITPETWFYDNYAGNAVDWTSKVDYSQEIEVTPMGQLTSKEFIFTYKKDTDYYNDDRYFKKYNEVFGQKKFVAENEFEKDQNKVELIFSPTISVQIPEVSQRVIPHIYKVNADGVKQIDTFNIRILQWGGLKRSYISIDQNRGYATWKIVDSSGVAMASYIDYPYAGMLDDPITPSRDLCFGPPIEIFFALNTYSDLGLFRFYWEPFINEITNKDSKLWKPFILLTPSDINQLDFKRLVKIDNTYFRLNKVENYKPMGQQTTPVELFKSNVSVEVVRPGFLKWSDDGYLLHSDESPARIPYA
ncbi:hypothetical protein FHW36_10671 [Chitinophaga polysaccharea]|uniref:Uncharacterized protein n=1 Tax=Chitinophaga polysaccharea TaxID=1293035 RepID=A0A561PL60_9BACT|nr:hypothetical protein [Chitinophaga polysaccharea]TWF38848.1 hypothetical protein FHW36_10671 [Chitinophaga polysaccharea]